MKKAVRLLSMIIAICLLATSLSVSVAAEAQSAVIESITVDDLSFVECTGGHHDEYYNEETQETIEYYVYFLNPHITVKFADGTVAEGDGYVLTEGEWGLEYHGFQCDYVQSYDNQLGVGTHTISGSVMDYPVEFEVEITESPYAEFEVLEVSPVTCDNLDKASYSYDNTVFYNYPEFKYKVTDKDGKSFISTYKGEDSSTDINLGFASSQYDEQWTKGGNNELKIYYTNICDKVNVEVNDDPCIEYTEQDGKAYITNIKYIGEELDIPSQVDGLQVEGIVSICKDVMGAKVINIPDCVKSLGKYAFDYGCSNLEVINIGKGVNNISANLLGACPNLKAVNVSEENTGYCSVDGVVYNKAVDKLVYFPVGKSDSYVVPATVDNIDVLNNRIYSELSISFEEGSDKFVTVDGVSYTADFKRLIACNKDKVGEFLIPSTVDEIAENAFENCTGLTSVELPSGVTEISYATFAGCTDLAEVKMPDSVKTIGDYAFIGCKSLGSIEFSESLETIGEFAFNSSGILSVDFPESLKEIKRYSFFYTNLSRITGGENLKVIGENAFFSTGIESVNISDSVESIGDSAFGLCENLSYVTLGAGLTKISSDCFYGCKNLGSIKIPENVEVIEENAFASCEKLNEVIFNEKCTYIGKGAFRGCGFEKVDLPKNLQIIEDGVFSGSLLTEVTIPDTVTDLVYSGFNRCKNLGIINVPEKVVNIGGHMFDNTKWYEEKPDGEVYLDHIFYGYKGDIQSDTVLSLKEGTLTIADYALENTYGITEIQLPDGLTTIGSFVAFGSKDLEKVNIPASVTDISEFAFVGCDALKEINVDPKNPNYSSVDGVLFNKDRTKLIHCPNRDFESYIIPNTVKEVGKFAFSNSNLSEVKVYNDDVVFDDCAVGINMKAFYFSDNSYKAEVSNTIVLCHKNSNAEKHCMESGAKFYYLEDSEKFSPIVTQTDSYTGVSVETDSQAELAVSKITSEETVSGIISMLKDKAVESVYDISLYKDGAEVQPDSTLVIRIPTAYKNAKVYHVESDGTLTDMGAVQEDGYLMVYTEHLSVFAVVIDTDAEKLCPYEAGDVNKDNKLNIRDATAIQKYLAKLMEFDDEAYALADFDLNGKVNIRDATTIQKKIANLI